MRRRLLAYLSDIFDSLNSLNLKLQGGNSNIVTHRDAIKMYIEKLQLCRHKISGNPCNYSSFTKIESISEETRFKDIYEGSSLKIQISNYLESLIEEFQKYFPNTCDDSIFRMSIDSFHVNIDSLPESLQEDAFQIKHDSSAKYNFDIIDKPSFWLKYFKVYPSVSREALRLYLRFSSTYLCEKAFSTLVVIKTKYRNKLDAASDLRCELTKTQPRIGILVKKMP
ncbi:protein FAM200A-like [Diabrotica undecimpunctata]|uniref:protein FAM200A-like n=1 Tax=Diabrotica undecimpunctata TaxID=50387 RepID=UPI003B634F10